MVNSPSRPILRPDAPPTPVECGGKTPLWNREACLPAHRMPVRNQTKSNHQASASRHLPLCMFFAVAPPLPSRSPNSETRTRFFPIKAKTPAIVPHQGSSRHPPKKHLPLESSPKLGDWKAKLPPPIPFASLRLCVKKQPIKPPQGSIKAKTPAIKANRA